MEIFILGDIHGEWGLANDSYDEMVARIGNPPDLLIQVGDYGYYPSYGINPFTERPDPYHYRKQSGLWERKFPHPAIFIDGNHEDHESLREAMKRMDEARGKDTPRRYLFSAGGAVWEHAYRGWCEDGILCIGGAHSVDKEYRLRWGHHWSELENLTREEVTPILEANHENVKVVISHTCPSSFDMTLACRPEYGGENKGEITRVLLQEVLEKYRPDYWFFGHWHKPLSGRHVFDDGKECKWQCLGIGEIAYFDTGGQYE